jgi:thioesterase domain-containing protein
VSRLLDQPLTMAKETSVSVTPNATARGSKSRALVERLWTRVLDRSSFERDLSFEDAGGDSLGILQFAFGLEELCGQSLPLELFRLDQRPTDFVRILDEATQPRTTADPTPTVFLFPGSYGFDPRLAHFAAGCLPAVKVEGVAYPGWREMIQPDFNFDKLVSQLVTHVLERAPSGPLLLMGHSWGGIVAYAAALTLLQMGRPVKFLGMLDADATPGLVPRPMPRLREGARWARLAKDIGAGEWRGLLRRVFRVSFFGKPATKRMLRRLALRPHFKLPVLLNYHLQQVINFSLRAQLSKGWRSQLGAAPLAVPCFVFRATDDPGNEPVDLGWGPYCANVTVIPVAGGHLTMLDGPNRTLLCARFVEVVKRALGPPSGAIPR